MKRIFSGILVVCMLLALILPAGAEDDTYNYVSLGASNVNGYGMWDYIPAEYTYDNPGLLDEASISSLAASGYDRAPARCYPSVVTNVLRARGVNVELHQLAQSASRVEELRYLLDDSYTPDGYTRDRFYDDSVIPPIGWWADLSGFDALRQDYRTRIAGADLISYDMGINDFGTYIAYQILRSKDWNDLHVVFGDKFGEAFYAVRGQFTSAAAALLGNAYPEDAVNMINSLLDTLTYALLGFEQNFDITVGLIRELNDSADMIVCSVQNVLAGLEISVAGIPIPVGDIFGIYVNLANAYISTLSPHKDTYCFANVSANGRVTYFWDDVVSYNGDPATLSEDILSCFDITDNHLYVHYNEEQQLNAYRETHEMDDAAAELLGQTALTRAYDAIATAMSAFASTPVLPVDFVFDGSAEYAELQAQTYALLESLRDLAISTTLDGTYDESVINARIADAMAEPAFCLVVPIVTRAVIGHSFCCHPTTYGAQQAASAVLYALDNEVSAREAAWRAVEISANKLSDMIAEYGADYAVKLVEKAGSVFGLDEGVVADITAKLPLDNAADALAEYLLNKLGIRSVDESEELNAYMDEIAAACETERLHVHKGVYHASVSATCTKEGCKGYFSCGCGKLFSDKNCTKEIDAASLVIPAKGHELVYVRAHASTILSPGNEAYYICSACGRLYEDKAGTRETTLAQLVIPRKSILKSLFGR